MTTKTKSTVRAWIKHTKIAIRRWKEVPRKNVDLSTFVQGVSRQRRADDDAIKHTCNTIACFGGWVAVMPEFVAMGVVPDAWGAPTIPGESWGSDVARELFGEYSLFDSAGGSRYDLNPVYRRGHDHETVTNRLDKHLVALKAQLKEAKAG